MSGSTQRPGASRPAGAPSPSYRLRSARDVLTLLEEQVEAVRKDPEAGALEKARTLGRLARTALKAVEVADLEGRVEALEAVLKERKPE